MDILGVRNAALTQAGARNLRASVADNSIENSVLDLWYVPSRDFVFTEAFWPSVRATEALALVSSREQGDTWETGKPPIPWKYAYAVPSGMLNARYIFPADADETQFNIRHDFPFIFDSIAGAPIIAANVENAVLSFSRKNENPETWTNHLLHAVIHMLAANITLSLTGQERIRDANYRIAMNYITMAKENQANADHLKLEEPESPMIESRGGYENGGYSSSGHHRRFR